MKNVLMIVHTFPPMGSVGGSIRIVKFLKYISELSGELKVTLVTLRDDIVLLNDPHMSQASLSEIPTTKINIVRTNTCQPRHPNPGRYGIRKVELDRTDKAGSNIFFKKLVKKIYIFIEKYILVPDYALLWAPYLIKKAVKESKNSVDVIYATAPPFSVLVMSAIISKITRKKLVLDIKDDWIHQVRFNKQPIILKKIEKKMESFCVKNADKIILVTPQSLDDFRKRYPQSRRKFELITNGCDVEEYDMYLDHKSYHNQKFTIIHSGIISTSRNPSSLFQAIRELCDEGLINKENFELKFIGPLPQDVLLMIREKNLTDLITNTKVLERPDYIKTIGKADILLAINYQIKTLIPGKIYDYWGSRRPILLIDSKESAASELIEKNNLGAVAELYDIPRIKEIIKNYFVLWRRNLFINETEIGNLYEYDRKNLTKKLITVFETI